MKKIKVIKTELIFGGVNPCTGNAGAWISGFCIGGLWNPWIAVGCTVLTVYCNA